MSGVTPEAHAERDPFANDVLERLVQSNSDYQREHGNYIVPLAQRLLDARAELVSVRAERDAWGKAWREETAELEAEVAQLRDALERIAEIPLGGPVDVRLEEAITTARSALAAVSEETPMSCPECHGSGEQRYHGCPGTFDPSCCGACERENCWLCGGTGVVPPVVAVVSEETP